MKKAFAQWVDRYLRRFFFRWAHASAEVSAVTDNATTNECSDYDNGHEFRIGDIRCAAYHITRR